MFNSAENHVTLLVSARHTKKKIKIVEQKNWSDILDFLTFSSLGTDRLRPLSAVASMLSGAIQSKSLFMLHMSFLQHFLTSPTDQSSNKTSILFL